MYEPKYAKLKEKYTMFDGVDFDKILVKYPKKKKKIMLELFEKFGKKGTLFSSDTKEFITVDDLDPSRKNVVVFDDCMTDKDQKSIEDFFVRVNPALRYRKKYFIPINKDGRVFAEENLRIQKKLPPLS
ncbi:uncharacterized protein TNCV_116851 [Trichonephila clavipes]|nr:uncharacterized protein TNCV_116851 [Trichonephila clavipes]